MASSGPVDTTDIGDLFAMQDDHDQPVRGIGPEIYRASFPRRGRRPPI
jgi:hypothetical protein